MKNKNEALKILIHYQKWRLGDSDLQMPNPKDITSAINFSIKILKKLDKC